MKREERQFYAAWAKIASAKQRRICVQHVIVRLVLAFGGPDRLAEKWVQAFNRASPTRQIRCCESMCWLLEKFQQHPESMDLRRIDDLETEERRVEIQIVEETFITQPSLIAALAAKHGFTLNAKAE